MDDAKRMQVINCLTNFKQLTSCVILIHTSIAYKSIKRPFFHVLHQDVNKCAIIENAISFDYVGMRHEHTYLQLSDELHEHTM
jgi:hypothetical protein